MAQDAQPTYVGLPNGDRVEIPPDATPEQLSQLRDKLAKQFPGAAPNLKTGAGMEFPAEGQPVPKMGKSTLGSIYGTSGDVLKGTVPAAAAIATGAFGAPELAPISYMAAKGIVSPKEVAEHPYQTGAEAALMGTPEAAEAFPTKGRAGQLFESVAKRIGTRPVNVQPAIEAAQEARALSESGMSSPKVVEDLLRFHQTPEMAEPRTQMGWQQARDFFSSANQLTTEERMGLKPRMQRQMVKLAREGFAPELERTAGEAGAGKDYARAIKMYRRAARMGAAAQALKKEAIRAIPWGAGTAIGGGLTYELMKGGSK
jgi:hypothetical protein